MVSCKFKNRKEGEEYLLKFTKFLPHPSKYPELYDLKEDDLKILSLINVGMEQTLAFISRPKSKLPMVSDQD